MSHWLKVVFGWQREPLLRFVIEYIKGENFVAWFNNWINREEEVIDDGDRKDRKRG